MRPTSERRVPSVPVRPGTRRGWQVFGACAWSAAALLADEVRARLTRHARPVPSGPARLRGTLERLGPTFVKLGQVLSTRPDLLSPAYEAELARLQDAAAPVPWSRVHASLASALGAPPEETFRQLSSTPLAAASIGQVHAGLLADGTDVVVKVRRPGVVEQVEVDLGLIDAAARAVARFSPMRRFDPVGLAREFATTLRRELDYTLEARNAQRLRAELSSMPDVEVPIVVWDLTTDSVLTETRVFGAKIDDLAAIDALALDRPAVARRFADAYLTMVFVHRFFHADPHPGNVFVEADGTIAFVDFGMVGEVDAATGNGLVAVLGALVAADAIGLAEALLHLGIADLDVDRAGLERDLEVLVPTYRDQRLEDLHLARLVGDLMAIVRRHDLHFPSRIALLLKTVVMCEGVAAQLDPDFRLVALLVPYAAAFARRDAPLGEGTAGDTPPFA